MEDVPLFSLLIQFILIIINAIFACVEIAVIESNEYKIKKMAEEGDIRAKRLLFFTGNSAKFLSTVQVAITLSGFLASAFAAKDLSVILLPILSKIGFSSSTLKTVSVVLTTILLSFFTLVFGELVPKKIAIKFPDEIALTFSQIIYFFYIVFSPIVFLLTKTTNGILKLLKINPEDDDKWEEEDIKLIINESVEDEVLEEDEKQLIENIFRFDDLVIKDLMVQRQNCELIDINDELFRNKVIKYKHSLIPVYKTTKDNIIGVLDVKNYLKTNNKRESIKKPFFVKNSITADILFRRMKKTQNKIAIIKDQSDRFDGIISINDLTNELISGLKNL